ncbi:hypothetical protein ACJMK2_027098 [Sinanodonta woodiana]|uniref:Uncharacterized protein n=1 Tax=Sinanodonta woodiana TaxID=1069815 RepID=A0ABD3XN87_SINWO
MHRILPVLCFLKLTIVLSVEGVSMTITPSPMVVDSSSANPVTPLQLRCSSDGTDNIETVYRLDLSRKRSSDPDFNNIASVDAYKTTTNFSPDMRSPNATGSTLCSTAGGPPTSGILIVTMDAGSLTCSDQAEFRCTMTYNMKRTATFTVSQSTDFTVITAPNDVRIIDALYEEGGIQLQLINDSKLNISTRIRYRCAANIGDDFNGTILWERSMGISTNFSTYIPTVSTDIVQDSVTRANCSFNLTSCMYYNLSSGDNNGTTFRCKVRAYLGGKWYESMSAHHRIFAVLTPSKCKYSTVTNQSLIEASTSGGSRRMEFKVTYAVLVIILSVYQSVSGLIYP